MDTLWTFILTLAFGLQNYSQARIRLRAGDSVPQRATLTNCSDVLLQQEERGLTFIFPQLVIKKPNSDETEPVAIDTYDPLSQEYMTRIVVEFYFKGTRHKLKLKHNSQLVATGLHAKGTQGYLQRQNVDNCYYQGTRARSSHNDYVSLSTCDGLRGVIEIDGVTHLVSPYGNSNKDEICRPHVVTVASPTKDRTCANGSGQWTPFEELHRYEFDQRRAANLQATERVKRTLEQKYLELALIIDHRMFEQFNLDNDQVTQFILQVTNMVDMYYQSLNIRVGLIYREFWMDEDDITVTSNARETLQNFLRYAENNLKNVNYDLAHLISGHTFDDESVGMAIPESICRTRAVAVISLPSSKNPQELASVLSHMIGHGIGLRHDTSDCLCDDSENGCIMGKDIGNKSPKRFSSCSEARLDILTRVGLGACLVEESTENPYQQFCGNGFVERGEQCDCGPPGLCEKKDPCCDASTCLLKSWAKCRTGQCCENCLPKQTDELCRSANGECDAPEYCDGRSGECPADFLIQDGEPCANEEGFCYQGRCPHKDRQCTEFWGPDSSSANQQCYTSHNLQASTYGHCGVNADGRYIRCQEKDALCGLLQCEGGASIPLVVELGYQKTAVGGNGNGEYECKTASAPLNSDQDGLGMVADGTKCDVNHMCLSHGCMHLSALSVPSCPTGDGNLTCSGRGRCTSGRTCHCNPGFSGILCNEVIPSTPAPMVSVESTTPDVSPVMDTRAMIISICVLIAVLTPAIIIGLVCYRRRAPENKPKKRKKVHSESESDIEKNRTISFGQTPSYKNERAGNKRKRRRRRRKSSSSEEETDSDERNQVSTPLPPVMHHDLIIPEELSRQPERGILKKSISRDAEEDGCCSSQCSCSDSGSCSCSDDESKPDNVSQSSRREQPSEIPPPVEFDTSIYTTDMQPSIDISPASSDNAKYSAPEADQHYKQFTSYDRYQPTGYHQHPDSATDSAIDMPGDGSVSTINEIPPVYHPSYLLRHSPPSSEHSEVPSEGAFYEHKPVLGRRHHKPQSTKSEHLPVHPIIYEQQRPNVLSLSINEESHSRLYAQPPLQLKTFQPAVQNNVTNSPSHQKTSRPRKESSNAVTV